MGLFVVLVLRCRLTITEYLGRRYIKRPANEHEVAELVSKFYLFRGLPQCIGAIDGTDVPIKEPMENASDFIKRKGVHFF